MNEYSRLAAYVYACLKVAKTPRNIVGLEEVTVGSLFWLVRLYWVMLIPILQIDTR